MTARHLVGALARRGIQHASMDGKSDYDKLNDLLKGIPIWGLALMATTLFLFVLAACSLEYTIRLVTAHLAMVEDPQTQVEVEFYTPASEEEAKIAQNLVDVGLIDESRLIEPTVSIKSAPITSSLRRTKRHITSIGGRAARWRGLPIFLLFSSLAGLSRFGMKELLRPVPFGTVIADVVVAVLLARLHCAWTHKVITMPSAKTLMERFITCEQWRELAGPTALAAGLNSLSALLIHKLFISSVLSVDRVEMTRNQKTIVLASSLLSTLIGAGVLGLCVMMPAYAALVRKEASLLAPEEETIVAMDRTFGGKLNHLGDKLTFADAFMSFTWADRRRLAKLYLKFFSLMVLFAFLAVHILGLEFFLVTGDKAREFVKDMHSSMKF